MADTVSQLVALPIGPNGRSVIGELITNKNGDSEWYQTTSNGAGKGRTSFALPTFTSNKSNNYKWQPAPNCDGGILIGSAACPSSAQRQQFYSNTSSITSLNNARLLAFNSPTNFNSPELAKQLNVPGANNTAPSGGTPTPQAPQQGGAPAPTPLPGPGESVGDLRTIDVPLESAQLAPIAPGSGLRYPKEMKTEQDKIKFQAVRIKPRTASGNPNQLQFGFGSPEYEIADDGPVCLAIQSPISDQNSVDWGPDSVSAIDAAIFNLSMNIVEQGVEPESLKNFSKDLYNTAKLNTGRIQRFLAGQAASLNNVLARTDNVILNPNLELLFQAPQLRPFTFQFKMSARNQGEAKEIKSIIKYFKYHMAVRKEKGIFLRAPHVFTIRYLKGEEEPHPGINLISPNPTTKACALTNCSVDYTPLGSYMTFNDGTMVSYTLSLQFQELTPIYDTDYAEEPGKSHPIGY
jgi:hypothetical protein